MLEAALWGLVGSSSLLAGAYAGLRFDVPSRAIGLVMGFGAGTLISAVSFELTAEAFRQGGADATAAGLALGAIAYFAGDRQIEKRGGGQRMQHKGRSGGETQAASSALLLGAILDGIPESAVIGISLLGGEGVGVAMVAAVFISNTPEAFSSTAGIREGVRDRGAILRRWLLVVLACTLASALGFLLLDGASGNMVALIQAFAAGAVLTMLADTMIPEAYEHGGTPTGLVTVLGFALAALLSATS